jgi:hypothetical protein
MARARMVDEKAKAAKLVQHAKSKVEREAQIKAQRERFRIRQRNKRIFNYLIISLIVIAIAYALYLAFKPAQANPNDALAKCLTKKGVVMYGTEWCTHCQEQKREFGDAFRYVSFVNCDTNADACKLVGVDSYPTWIFSDGSNASGLQPLDLLAQRTGCE